MTTVSNSARNAPSPSVESPAANAKTSPALAEVVGGSPNFSMRSI